MKPTIQNAPYQANSDEPYLGENLIFILSQPRSGSTLLQRVLGGHSDVLTTAETWLMLHPIYGKRQAGIETEYGAKWRREAVLEYIENYITHENVEEDAIRAWARVMYGRAVEESGKKVFLDKTPRYFFIIPELIELFPAAKFVFLYRNPMAVLASELETYVKDDWSVLGLFAPDLVKAPDLLLAGQELIGDRAITVHYEEFVTDPERNTRQLCVQLGLPYEPGMVEYSNTPAPKGKMNDPKGIHQHSRPSTKSKDQWMKMVESKQNLHIAQSYLKVLGRETIERLGYDYDEIESTLGQSVSREEVDVLPWDIAVTPSEHWNLRQRHRVERYNCVHEKGKLLGSLAAMKRFAFRNARKLSEELKYPNI